ncbi:MAG: NUDIX domain-containing protein [Candidatus Shapirobacteria bacterium]|nr:NUDIX domain-containing protein [Candidatus Shapirobacteria bacterium]
MSNQYIKVSVHGFIKKEDKILVTQRPLDDDYMPEFWDTPGGTLEFGEKCIDGLIREIKEETGLTVKVGKIIYCFDHLSNPQRHQFTLVYECEYINGNVNLDPKEHQNFKWLTFEEVKKLPQKIHFLEELVNYLQK